MMAYPYNCFFKDGGQLSARMLRQRVRAELALSDRLLVVSTLTYCVLSTGLD